MAEDLKHLLLQAIEAQIREGVHRPSFSWTDGLSQMTLGIWATGTDAYNQPYLCLGAPEEEMGEETGDGGTIYLENFQVREVHRGIGDTTRFDLSNHTGGEYFVWVAGDWRPQPPDSDWPLVGARPPDPERPLAGPQPQDPDWPPGGGPHPYPEDQAGQENTPAP